MPLQIGLAIHLHDHFHFKYLTDTLYLLGFTKSYKEVRRYERSATLTFKHYDVNITLTQKVQFMANNVDLNPCNLGEKNTIHYMIIALNPFFDDTFHSVPWNNISNDHVKDLSTQMVKHFDMEEIKKLGEVK